jgi:hypothetical protein
MVSGKTARSIGNRTRQPAHNSHSLAEPTHEATVSRSANVAGRRVARSSVTHHRRSKKTVELLAMEYPNGLLVEGATV